MLTPPSPVLTPERSGPQARPLPELPLPRPWWARSDSGSGQDREAHRRGGEGGSRGSSTGSRPITLKVPNRKVASVERAGVRGERCCHGARPGRGEEGWREDEGIAPGH